MIRFVRQVAEWGIRPETPRDQAHHYRLTNVLLVFLFAGSVVQTALLFLTGATEAALVNSTAPFVFASGLLLMKSGHTVLARLFVITICYVAGYAVIASLGPEPYFQFIFLFAGAFALGFFSVNEKPLLIYGLVAPLIAFVALELTGYAPIWGMSRAQLGPTQILIMRVLSMTVIWLLMVFYFFYFTRDRRRAQEKLVASAKLEALGRMAAGIAHEVTNPAQLIIFYAERLRLAADPSAAGDEIRNIAERVHALAMRIGSINKGLLALSRDSEGDPFVEVKVHAVVDLSLNFCRAQFESQKIELRVGEISRDCSVQGRETQISEVILNLLNNASDAVAGREGQWIRLDVEPSDEFVDIGIADSGPGVPQHIRHRIFDPFFTTKPVGEGTGLGLSVSQGIANSHRGQIFLDADASETRFVLRLPRA